MFWMNFSFRRYFEPLHSFTFRINPFRKDSGLILQTYWLGRLILLGVLICTINGILQFLIPLNLILLHLLIRHLTLISLIICIDLVKLLHFGLLLVFTGLNLNLIDDIRKIILIILSSHWLRLKSLKIEKYNICNRFILISLLIIFLNYLFRIFLIIGIIFLKLNMYIGVPSLFIWPFYFNGNLDFVERFIWLATTHLV